MSATKHGSDKVGRTITRLCIRLSSKGRWNQPLRVLELGLGSNNPDVPSNMGVFGVPGASHRGWREAVSQRCGVRG